MQSPPLQSTPIYYSHGSKWLTMSYWKRGEFCGIVLVRKVNFNLACGVFGFEKLTCDAITESFRTSGLFPFKPLFGAQFRSPVSMRNEAIERTETISRSSVACRMQVVIQRQSDVCTFNTVQEIIAQRKNPAKKL